MLETTCRRKSHFTYYRFTFDFIPIYTYKWNSFCKNTAVLYHLFQRNRFRIYCICPVFIQYTIGMQIPVKIVHREGYGIIQFPV